MKDHTEQKIYSYLKEHEEEILEDILTLVKAESPSTDKAAVDACAEVLRALYQKRLGETPEVIPREKSGNCLRLRLGKGEKKLMLLGHFDTVHPLGSLPVREIEALKKGSKIRLSGRGKGEPGGLPNNGESPEIPFRQKSREIPERGVFRRNQEVRHDFQKGDNSENSVSEFRMGHPEPRGVNNQLPEKQHIQIQRPRAPVPQSYSPVAVFQILKSIQQGLRVQLCAYKGHRIDKIRLILRPHRN